MRGRDLELMNVKVTERKVKLYICIR